MTLNLGTALTSGFLEAGEKELNPCFPFVFVMKMWSCLSCGEEKAAKCFIVYVVNQDTVLVVDIHFKNPVDPNKTNVWTMEC